MSPELLTAYRLMADIADGENITYNTKAEAEKHLLEFMYIVGKETELEKQDVEQWAAKAAGIIIK